jgi:hypothetical protein
VVVEVGVLWLLVSLLVRLHVIEGLHYSLHQIVLSGNQLLLSHCTSCSLSSPSERLIGHGYKILQNLDYMQQGI